MATLKTPALSPAGVPQADANSVADATGAGADAAPRAAQPRNPLHGVTLEQMVLALQAAYGWDGLADRVPLRCFSHEPSLGSSLKLLRKTPWAREKIESLYLFMQRERRRADGRTDGRIDGRAAAPK